MVLSSYHAFTDFQKYMLGLVFGVLALITFVVFGILAYINSPNYDPVVHTISKLGIQTPEGGLYFTIGVVLGGVFIFLYFWIMRDVFPFKSHRVVWNRELTYWSHILSLAGSVFLILVGLLPDRGITVIPHFLVAAAMFTCIGVAIFIWSLTLWEDYSQRVPFTKFVALLGFITCGIAVLHGFFSSIKFYGPIWQKTAVLFYLLWFLVFNAWMWRVVRSLS